MKKNKKRGYIIVEVILAMFIVVLSSLSLLFTISNVKLYFKKNEQIQLLYDIGENIILQDLKNSKVKSYIKSELNKSEYNIDYNNVDINLKNDLGENKIHVKKMYTLLFSKYNLYKINYTLKMGNLKIKLNTKTRFIVRD